MSSASGQSSNLSKSVNTQIQSAPAPTAQAYTGNPDSNSQRRGVGNPGALRNSSVPKANQARRQQHKRHRRPRLVDEDAFAESVAVRNTMSRKGQTSITHLMNFSLPPRPHAHQHYAPSRPPPRRSYGLGLRSGAVDKARYVHANYRFIVDPTKDYYAQAADANRHLDWNTVLQVLVSSQTQQTSCPICLSTPVAPRMAKCGHVFCLPCLIRYMNSVDDSNPVFEKKARWKKCPICWDAIYISDTRCVAWYAGQQVDLLMEGGDVLLRLIWRMPRSTLALPCDGAVLGPEEDIPWYHIADVPDYARIMKGGEDYMMSHYDQEIEDLGRLEHEDELLFGEDSTWTQKAISAIKDAKEKIRGIGNPPELSRELVERRPARSQRSCEESVGDAPDMYLIERSIKSGSTPASPAVTPLTTETGKPSVSQSDTNGVSDICSGLSTLSVLSNEVVTSTTPEKLHSPGLLRGAEKSKYSNLPYYFYQALPHFYLSPLDIRILKAEFGDFSQFPSTILPRVEHISTGHIVDDELLNRMKYLNHLPYGCEVSFLECDWTDLVSPSNLEKFAPEINRRRKRNVDKATREEKERIRAEKEEDEKRWATARRKRSSISAPSNQPFSDSDFQPLITPSKVEAAASESDTVASPPFGPSRGEEHPSFAALASPSSSPPTHRTVWGTTAVGPSPEPLAQPSQTQGDDGWLQDWERELLLAEQEGILAQVEEAATPSSGKKKKTKKITLMSTNARRAA